MRPERFEAIDELLGWALELPPEERLAFVERECQGRPETRARLERLLAADEAAEGLLETAFKPPWTASAEVLPGTLFGPYRVEREIGRGGMGAVFLGSRDDGEYQRRVAIKVLGPGRFGPGGLARFRIERESLASLEHPGIARLYDSGRTGRGEPFLVMEYVDGEALDAFCNRCRLSLEARLRLIVKVLDAVGFAHRNLLVHRDLKPANILVCAEGEPKLIDFGIAKLLDGQGQGVAEASPTSLRAMTPSYASPEQIRGEPIGIATDLYSLGVVLCELLCGERPYRLSTGLPHELERAVLEQEPRKPSQALAACTPELAEERARSRSTSPRLLIRRLRGDLDTIVTKALAKKPRHRYGSAAEFAADLERHLAGQPVAARPDRFSYRAGKFLRRHWLASSGVGMAVVVFLGLLASTLAQRNRALAESDKARQALEFMVETFRQADPRQSGGDRVSAKELLEVGFQRISQELDAAPEVRATLMDALGEAALGLGRLEQAATYLEAALNLRRAADLAPHDLAQSLLHVGHLKLRHGEHAAAEALLREALGVERRATGENSPEVAEVLNQLGVTLREAYSGTEPGRLEEIESLHREALRISSQAEGADSIGAAVALFSLAKVMELQGDLPAAEQAYRHSLELQVGARGRDHSEVANCRGALAEFLIGIGRLEEAREQLEEALRVQRERLGTEHPDLLFTANELAAVESRLGHFEAAEPLLRAVVAGQLAYTGERHPHAANVLYNLAMALQNRGEIVEAASLHQRALAVRIDLFGERSLPVAQSLGGLARLESKLGRHAQATARARRGLEISRELLAPGHPELAWPLRSLGGALLAGGRAAEAEAPLRESVALLERTRPASYFQTAVVRLLLAECLLARDDTAEAEVQALQALEVLAAQFPETDRRVQDSRRLLARVAASLEAKRELSSFGQEALGAARPRRRR